MGRLSNDPGSLRNDPGSLSNDPTIHHFSHPHPLYLSSLTPSLTPLSCAACTLPTSTSPLTYSCTPCNFHLHVPCSRLSPLIHHPSHPAHQLTLLPVPAYPNGYSCDACARAGSAFSYHCSECGVDLHVACAALPLSVNHYAHPHPLMMVFCPPYADLRYTCDVCGSFGGNHWLYRCALCGFDAHLGCGVVGGARTGVGIGTGIGQAHPMSVSQGLSRVGSGSGGLVRDVLSGIVDGGGQQIGQNLLQGFMGGGGGSGNGGRSSILNVGSAILGGVLGGSGFIPYQ